ncbi:MAG: 50S ribosomal protein L30 [Acidobacteriota bacterium]
MAEQGEAKRVVVKLVKSGIGFCKDQKEILRGLGLLKLNQTVSLKDTPSIRGMINKVPHLVKVIGTGE